MVNILQQTLRTHWLLICCSNKIKTTLSAKQALSLGRLHLTILWVDVRAQWVKGPPPRPMAWVGCWESNGRKENQLSQLSSDPTCSVLPIYTHRHTHTHTATLTHPYSQAQCTCTHTFKVSYNIYSQVLSYFSPQVNWADILIIHSFKKSI